MTTVAIIGGGKMAEAIIRGMIHKQFCSPKNITVSDVSAQRLEDLSKSLGVNSCLSNIQAVRNQDIVILAVKPQVAEQVLPEIHSAITADQIFVSIAAGITIAALCGAQPLKVARVMPNTPALVGEAASAVSFNPRCQESDKKSVNLLLKSFGSVVEVEETMLNAVTGLSGSGPAFVFRLIQGFIAAGKELGLPENVAKQLALQTFKGSAILAANSNETLDQLIENVTSPQGTTAAGRAVLENSGVLSTLKKTIWRAKERADELSRGEE